MATARALQLKEDGNACFKEGKYVSAEALYSKAIIIDPTNPLLFTNRAMARLQLGMFESVITDCKESLSLLADNMKAYYHLAQAQIELGSLEEAYENAQRAYELSSGVKTGVVDQNWYRSLGPITTLVLRCKKELWERKEDERLRVRNGLLEEMCGLMRKRKEEQLARIMDLDEESEEAAEVEREWKEKEDELRRVWDSGVEAEGKRREVPDWAIDNITFAVMHDPVITKTGQSYERASITEHLRRSQTDPLTREPLRVPELRPNLGLKAACAEFLEKNGWAVDW